MLCINVPFLTEIYSEDGKSHLNAQVAFLSSVSILNGVALDITALMSDVAEVATTVALITVLLQLVVLSLVFSENNNCIVV